MNLSRFSLFLLFVFVKTHFVLAQECSRAVQYTSYPISSEVSEVSGITVLDNRIFVIGDSGNEPNIYEIDLAGNVLRSIELANSLNVDWEEIQSDEQGNLYIGDIGNNLGNRQDLVIYKIPNASDSVSNQVIIPEKLSFSYEDQMDFTPDAATNYDCEAFIIIEDKIHLFSKDRSGIGLTKIYSLALTSDFPQEAVLLDSYQLDYWITAAFYNASQDQLFLLSDDKLNIYEEYSAYGLENKICSAVYSAAQLEGITRLSSGEILLTEDVESGASSRLFHDLLVIDESLPELILYQTERSISWKSTRIFDRFQILDSFGREVQNTKLGFLESTNGAVSGEIELSSLPVGVYFIRFSSEGFSATRGIILD